MARAQKEEQPTIFAIAVKSVLEEFQISQENLVDLVRLYCSSSTNTGSMSAFLTGSSPLGFSALKMQEILIAFATEDLRRKEKNLDHGLLSHFYDVVSRHVFLYAAREFTGQHFPRIGELGYSPAHLIDSYLRDTMQGMTPEEASKKWQLAEGVKITPSEIQKVLMHKPLDEVLLARLSQVIRIGTGRPGEFRRISATGLITLYQSQEPEKKAPRSLSGQSRG